VNVKAALNLAYYSTSLTFDVIGYDMIYMSGFCVVTVLVDLALRNVTSLLAISARYGNMSIRLDVVTSH